MAVQRNGVKLSQDENLFDSGIEGIGNGDIDQPVFAADRNRRFRPVARERKKPFALASAENNRKVDSRITLGRSSGSTAFIND